MHANAIHEDMASKTRLYGHNIHTYSVHTHIPAYTCTGTFDIPGLEQIYPLLSRTHILITYTHTYIYTYRNICHHWFGTDIPIVFEDCMTSELMKVCIAVHVHIYPLFSRIVWLQS
jgi:hypothetical protein